MRFVAEYSMKGPIQAWIATILLSIMMVFFSPFGLLLGAVVALITLRINLLEGFKAMLMATVLCLVINLWVNGSYWPAMVLIMEFILPVWFMASALRLTNDLSKTLALALLMAGLVVLVFHLLVGEPQLWWQQVFEQYLMPVLEQSQVVLEPGVMATLNDVSEMITLLFSLVMVMIWFSTLLLARWWQATLFYPGKFKADFHQLKLPRNIAVLAVLIALAGVFFEMSLLQSLTAVLMAGFMFQGLALFHQAVTKRAMSQAWLVGLYVFMFLFPQTILILATIGLSDTWLDVRNRWINE